MPIVHQSILGELVCIFLNGKHYVKYFLYVVIKSWYESLGSLELNKLQQCSLSNLFRKVSMLSLLKLLFIT